MKKYIITAIVFILAAVIGYRIYQSNKLKKEVSEKQVSEKVYPVKINIPKNRVITETIKASGNIQAESEVIIYPKVSGKIIKNYVALGSSLKPGDIICSIDRDEPGYEYNSYELKSNVKGVVSKLHQNTGAAVSPTTPVVTLVDIDNVKAVAAVDELKIRFIKKGQSAAVSLQAYPGEVFIGKVTNISPVCNSINRTVDVEVMISNKSQKVKPGMYATVEFTEGSRNALLIPISSLIEKMGKKYVFIESSGFAKSIPVITGAVTGDEIEIISGLTGNENIITTNAEKINDNEKVKIIK